MLRWLSGKIASPPGVSPSLPLTCTMAVWGVGLGMLGNAVLDDPCCMTSISTMPWNWINWNPNLDYYPLSPLLPMCTIVARGAGLGMLGVSSVWVPCEFCVRSAWVPREFFSREFSREFSWVFEWGVCDFYIPCFRCYLLLHFRPQFCHHPAKRQT
jgi:hypothetical protein